MPRDLLAKIEHDASRVVADPTDTYAAFDFFVTARHLEDWLDQYYGERVNRFEPARLGRLVRSLANGGKHFTPDNDAVGSVEHRGVFDPGVFDPGIFDTARLTIQVAKGDLAELKLIGTTVDVQTLLPIVIADCRRMVREAETRAGGQGAFSASSAGPPGTPPACP
jgi:hypothetical protein